MKCHSIACFFLTGYTTIGLASAPNHCETGEEVLFNCVIKNSRKIASVCGITNIETGASAYIQYRFGLPGKVEFQFPDSRRRDDVMNRFRIYGGRNGQFLRLTTLGFENHGYIYEVWFSEERLRGAGSRRSASVVTFRSGSRGRPGAMHEFECKNANEREVELIDMGDIVRDFSSPGFRYMDQLD